MGHYLNTVASDKNSLEKRIKCNEENQSLDLVAWIFDKLKIEADSTILELCCGTGKQTSEFLKIIGDNGRLLAIDISKESIKEIEQNIMPGEQFSSCAVVGKMETFPQIAKEKGFNHFDLSFCAYGLYYSNNPIETLNDLKKMSIKSSKIVIVGPYGENNFNLFDFLEKLGVKIPAFVKHSSQKFMTDVVFPWALENSNKVTTYTAKNEIIWKKSEDLLNYWMNSTFFDEKLIDKVQDAVIDYFNTNNEFLVAKHIMMIEILIE